MPERHRGQHPGEPQTDLDATVEEEKKNLFNTLETTLKVESLVAVAEVAKGINQLLAEYLTTRIVALASKIFVGSTQTTDPNVKGFSVNDKAYELLCSVNDLRHPDVLLYVISEYGQIPGAGSNPYPEIEVPLVDGGQYRAVHFCFPRTIKPHHRFLSALTIGIMSAGHVWMTNKITRAIRMETAKVATSLYEYMRVMLSGKNDLLKGFLFSCLFEGKDFVILDEYAAAGALELASGRASSYRRSASSMVLQLVSEIIGKKDTVIADACDSRNKVTRVTLGKDGKYYHNTEEFTDAMAVVWKSSVTCYPVVRAGAFRLVAFFPTPNESALIPILDVHRSELEKTATAQFEQIRAHLTILEAATKGRVTVRDLDGKWTVAKGWAEITGTFVGAVAAAWAKVSQ